MIIQSIALLLLATSASAAVPLASIEAMLETNAFRRLLLNDTAEGLALKLRLRQLDANQLAEKLSEVRTRLSRVEKRFKLESASGGLAERELAAQLARNELRLRWENPEIEFLNSGAQDNFSAQERAFANANRNPGRTMYLLEQGDVPERTAQILSSPRKLLRAGVRLRQDIARYASNVSDDLRVWDTQMSISRHTRPGMPKAAYSVELSATYETSAAPSQHTFIRSLSVRGFEVRRLDGDVAIYSNDSENLMASWSRDPQDGLVKIMVYPYKSVPELRLVTAENGLATRAAALFHELAAFRQVPDEVVTLVSRAAEETVTTLSLR